MSAPVMAEGIQPPSGGCVLKPSDQALQRRGYDSRLQAAVC